jgi:transposase-like protein
MSSNTKQFSLKEFHGRFPNDDVCLEEIKQLTFGNTLDCPKCKKNNAFYRVKGRSAYACSFCGHHIYPLKGTPFAHSSTPLTTWFYAMYLMAQTRSGVSAKTLERMTGVTYKTAWRMFHQIRKLMLVDDGTPLGGSGKPVEVDETYFHPNPAKNTRLATKSKTGKRYYNSQIIFGAVERGGRAKVWHVQSSGTRSLMPKIIGSVATNTMIYSDEWRAYSHLPKFHYTHATINHSIGKYVNGDTHTQNIENLWSHAKLGIRGVYRHVGDAYLASYANEYAFRYSYRNMPKFMFDLILERVSGYRAAYL